MKKLKAFFGSKYFWYWIMCAMGWTVGRGTKTGQLDDALIGGLIVSAILVGIIAFIGQTEWWAKLMRKS